MRISVAVAGGGAGWGVEGGIAEMARLHFSSVWRSLGFSPRRVAVAILSFSFLCPTRAPLEYHLSLKYSRQHAHVSHDPNIQ